MGLMPDKMSAPGGMPAPQAGRPPMDQPQGDPRYTDEEDSDVSPEEQAQYSKFEENYLKMIYADGGEVNPEIMKSLSEPAQIPPEMEGEQPSPPIAALGTTAVTIIETLDDSAREAGKPLSDDVLTQGGIAVIEELAEVAEAAKIHDYTDDEMQGAVTFAMFLYKDKAIADGRTDADTLGKQWGQIQQLNSEGRDDELLGAMGQDDGGQ